MNRGHQTRPPHQCGYCEDDYHLQNLSRRFRSNPRQLVATISLEASIPNRLQAAEKLRTIHAERAARAGCWETTRSTTKKALGSSHFVCFRGSFCSSLERNHLWAM